jgi:hypothetical protein
MLIAKANYSQQNILLNGYADKNEYSISIPFEYEQSMVIVSPVINGKKKKFIFDTGAPTAINHRLLKELNIPISEKNTNY